MKLKMIINLFGGPGVGKSTVAADLFCKMKREGYNVELVTEYAKELTYDERFKVLDEDQLYVFAKQHRRILRLKDQVDFIITDSPLLLSIVYAGLNPSIIYDSKIFQDLVLDVNSKYKNMNILLERNENYEYKQEGRYQNADEALITDRIIRETMCKYSTSMDEIVSDNKASTKIMNYVRKLTI
jgi:hypothetical protein